MPHTSRKSFPLISTFAEFMELYSPSSIPGQRFKKMYEAQELSKLSITSLREMTTVLLCRGLMSHHKAAASAFVSYRHHLRKKERSACTSSA